MVDPSWATPTFTLPYIQIYVDTDGIVGSGRTDTIQNANMVIEPAHAWEFMLNLEGQPGYQYVLFANGTKVTIPVVGDSIAKTVTSTFNQSITGQATTNWKYVVLVGSKDYNSFRVINAQTALWTLGGRSDSSWDPNVIDMLVPQGKNQEELFGNWSANNYLATAYAVGPGIAYEVDNTPPNVTITGPGQGSTIQAVNNVASIPLTWDAADNVGLSRAEIYINQILVKSLIAPASNTTVLWYQNGNINITLRWFDLSDRNFADDSITLTITGVSSGAPNPYYTVPVPTDIVNPEYPSSSSTSTASTLVTSTSTKSGSAPGFEALPLLFTMVMATTIYIRRRSK